MLILHLKCSFLHLKCLFLHFPILFILILDLSSVRNPRSEVEESLEVLAQDDQRRGRRGLLEVLPDEIKLITLRLNLFMNLNRIEINLFLICNSRKFFIHKMSGGN